MDSAAFSNILYVSRALGNFKRQVQPDEALMPSQTNFISFIFRNPGCSQDYLAKENGMDKTTVAHRLNKLEELGYIRRLVSESDARCRLLYLTPKGEEIYPIIHEQYLTFRKAVLNGFSEEELLLLDTLTSRMKANARQFLSETGEKERIRT